MASSDGIASLLPRHSSQRESKNRAASRVRPGFDLAAMGFDNGTGNRQADTGAMGLGGDERLKQLTCHVRRDPGSGVGDADRDHPVAGRPGRHDQLSLVAALHRLDRVSNEIEQNLLDLNLVGKHEIDRRIELEPHTDAPVLGADQRERACFLDKLVDALDRRSLSPRARKSRKRWMICPARTARSAAFSMASRSIAERSSEPSSKSLRIPFM